MIMRFPEGRTKALTLSYDDGVEQDEQLMAILDAYGLKCTFNLNSGCYPPAGHVWPKGSIHRRMPEERVAALYGNSGHEVAVHTLTHPDLSQLPSSDIVREVMTDRQNLERLFGTVVRGAAYPFGTYSQEAVDALRSCGIAYCRTVESSHDFSLPQDWLRLKPTCHHADPALNDLCDAFLNDPSGWRTRMFYLWGHAYEFERDDNWHIISDFAQRMGGRDDIWYATNIEIYDYVTAWRQLRTSADGRLAQNPTAIPLWAETGAERVTLLPPGETVDLTKA